MNRPMTILALLVLASATAAEEPVTVIYAVPAGTSPGAVVHRLRAFREWGAFEGSEALRSPFGTIQAAQHSETGHVRIHVDEPPDEALLASLDAIVKRCYLAYREARLRVIGEEIERWRAETRKAQQRLREVRERLEDLFRTGEGVLGREKALAANAERIEELRRRTVDAGIEVAVIDATLRALRHRIARRREDGREAVLAPLREQLRRLRESGLGESHAGILRVQQKIREAETGPLPDDALLDALVDRLADLEVEQIATEERIKALSEAHRSARELGIRILRAVDLDAYRTYELGGAIEDEEFARETLRLHEEEAATLKSDALPRRVVGRVKRR
jgi:hypothetical protein